MRRRWLAGPVALRGRFRYLVGCSTQVDPAARRLAL